jgi:hypothetical protein
MSKPILIVKFPNSYPPQVGEGVSEYLNSRDELVNDYHIFTILNNEDTFDFKVFNGEYAEYQYMNLKEIIDELKK